ncbi:MAG TPA: hypothetical protein VLB27_01140 [candidate division Zixibacteria bacterium]|nr:hypothetical protein [candidate division Zixibacteria bacterium]
MSSMSGGAVQYHFGLLGERVDYSRSPEIFGALFSLAGVTGEFTTFNCAAVEIPALIANLPTRGVGAVCVTIPHKESIIPNLSAIDEVASAIRSVNSVRFVSGGATGMNTDAYGFSAGLGERVADLKGRRALTLGAGGAARSAAYALALDAEVESIAICARNVERAERSISLLRAALPRVELAVVPWTEEDNPCAYLAENFDIVVNATPLGGPNQRAGAATDIVSLVAPTGVYYDLNYNVDNELLQAAVARGVVVVNGLPMLIHQALRSFALWTGIEVDYAAAAARLERHD